MAIALPVDRYVPGNEKPGYYGPPTPGKQTAPFTAPGVPQVPSTTTSGTGSSPGSPASPTSTTSSGPSIGIVDYYKAKSVGLLRPSLTSHYRCKFYPQNISGNDSLLNFLKSGNTAFPGSDYSNIFNQELIELSCSEASLPGASLMTNEIIDDHTGVTERPAYRRQYDDRIDFTFYVDYDYRIINFFERWISYCVGENLQSELNKENYFYRANFPDDYQVSELYITKFERDNSGYALEYKFIRAYPISITSMPISYDSSQLLKCTVSFSFIRYVRKMIKIEKPLVAGAVQNFDGSWNVDIFENGSITTVKVSNEEYNRKYKNGPRI